MPEPLYADPKNATNSIKWKRSTLVVGQSGAGKTTALAASLVAALKKAVNKDKRVRPIMLLLPEWSSGDFQWAAVEYLLKRVFGQYFKAVDFRNGSHASKEHLPLVEYASCSVTAFRLNASPPAASVDGYAEVLEWLERRSQQSPILVMDEPRAVFKDSLTAFMDAIPRETTLLWATPTADEIPREYWSLFQKLISLKIDPSQASRLLTIAQHLGGQQPEEFVKAALQLGQGQAVALKNKP